MPISDDRASKSGPTKLGKGASAKRKSAQSKSGVRSESVRVANLSTVLRQLHLHGQATRSELVAHTGLTRSSVAALVGQLVEAGLVTESSAPGTGIAGRPSPIVATNAAANAVYAIEISVDSVSSAIVGLGGEVLVQGRLKRSRGQSGVAQTMRDIKALDQQMQTDAKASTNIAAFTTLVIGVAVVGLVSAGSTVVEVAPNLGWSNVDLGHEINNVLDTNLPTVVANEGDLGALAETTRGRASNVDNVIYLSGEVGVGGGIIVDGKPLSGRSGFAGELGHMPVNPAGSRCACGAVGCWETEVGEQALLKRFDLDHVLDNPNQTATATATANKAIDDAIKRSEDGDKQTLLAFAEHGRWLGIGIAGLINIFDPEMVVLGGLFHRIFPHVIGAIDAELALRLVNDRPSEVTISASALGNDASLIGASELAFEQILRNPLGP